MEELHCHFLGVVEGDETVDEVAGGEGLAGGASNGSGGSLFLVVFSMLSWLEEAWVFEVV